VITPVAGPAPSPLTCEGDIVYTFTYTDCAGNTHDWTYTYTIDIPDFTLPVNGASTVNCPADAVAPTPPSVTDACGNVITPIAGPARSLILIAQVIHTIGLTLIRSIFLILFFLVTDHLP
jgi:hypothetical protein